jgi:hypothetical protein
MAVLYYCGVVPFALSRRQEKRAGKSFAALPARESLPPVKNLPVDKTASDLFIPSSSLIAHRAITHIITQNKIIHPHCESKYHSRYPHPHPLNL